MEKKSKKNRKVNFLSLTFPPYLTSHTNPQNLRRYIANKERLNSMDRSSFHAWGKPKSISKKKLTWPQAKIRFPLLKPMVDTDRDGVINLLDCRPFDRRRQHEKEIAIGFETIKGMKTVRDIQKLEEEFLKKEEARE